MLSHLSVYLSVYQFCFLKIADFYCSGKRSKLVLKICHFLSYGLVLNKANKTLGCVSGV